MDLHPTAYVSLKLFNNNTLCSPCSCAGCAMELALRKLVPNLTKMDFKSTERPLALAPHHPSALPTESPGRKTGTGREDVDDMHAIERRNLQDVVGVVERRTSASLTAFRRRDAVPPSAATMHWCSQDTTATTIAHCPYLLQLPSSLPHASRRRRYTLPTSS